MMRSPVSSLANVDHVTDRHLRDQETFVESLSDFVETLAKGEVAINQAEELVNGVIDAWTSTQGVLLRVRKIHSRTSRES